VTETAAVPLELWAWHWPEGVAAGQPKPANAECTSVSQKFFAILNPVLEK